MKLASKCSARGCFAALIAFALICLPAYALAFGPVNAAHADLVAQTMHLPDVTDDMTDPAYWSNKQKDPDKVLIKRGAIDRLNLANVQADGTMLQPLKTAREYYYDAEKQIALKTRAEEEMTEFIGQAEDENGDILTQADADAILANYPTDGSAPTIASQYAIVTTHTTMRTFPTNRMMGLTPGDQDDDNLYLSALRVNEPLIVRAQSVDKNYFLCISSCLSGGWVPAEDIAICASKAEWLTAWDIPIGHELVVTGYKVRTEQTRVTPNTADRMLYMGTVLERIDLAKPEDALELVGTRSAYYNHVCFLPVRNSDGTYSKEPALIAESSQVNEGYLPLTKANVAKVAFNSLGQMYGWGGMLEANDCSGYVRDVYKCFGLELARNTTWQMNQVVRSYDLTGLDDAHKAAAIEQMPLGTVLFWGGHEMIYLGQDNGKLYVISSLGSVGDIYGTKSGPYQIKSVAINTLNTVRGNGQTWLTTLTCANIPYIPSSSAGVAMTDISFYKDSITLPASSYAYTGKTIKPEVTIPGLTAGTDFKVSYANNKKAGTATITVTGKGNYKGSQKVKFTIEPKEITPTVSLSATKYAYTGKAMTPKVTAKAGKTKLTKGTDYTVAYSSGRKNVGTYNVKVKLKGNYSGTNTVSFKVVKAANTATTATTKVAKSVKLAKVKKRAQRLSLPKVTTKFGNAIWKVAQKDTKKVLSLKSGKVIVKKGAKKGTYAIKLQAYVKGTTNYTAAKTKVVTVKVTVK